MTYRPPIHFAELLGFSKEVLRLLDDDEFAKLQTALSLAPGSGKVIKTSEGLRKLRWAGSGRGKSGGLRVIYYWWVAPEIIILCDIYPKNEKENLSPRDIQDLCQQVESFRRQYGKS
jgi:mRNA-degrading endonuclease RelE of RelBE toxin-antitoxin system